MEQKAMSYWTKIIPILPKLVESVRDRNWPLFWRQVLYIVVVFALGSGLVVLSGCGTLRYDSGATPQANKQVIERIEAPK